MALTEADTESCQNKTYTEIFEEQFPFYLSLGMSAKEYWEGECALPLFYRRAYKMKRRKEMDENNFLAWLHGLYVRDAIASCKFKNHRYPKEPYDLWKQEEPKTKAEVNKAVRTAAENFAAFVAAKNAEFTRKQKNRKVHSENMSDNDNLQNT